MKSRIRKYISVFVLSALLLVAGCGEAKKRHGDRTLVPFCYQEQYEDIETGLYYNRFRYSEEAKGASVRYIDPSDNRAADSAIAKALCVYPDGTKNH